jgi:hypothetical protein
MRKNWALVVPTVSPVAVPNGRVCADGDTVGTAGPASRFFSSSKGTRFAPFLAKKKSNCANGTTVGTA